MQKQFYLKQFSLTQTRSLNAKNSKVKKARFGSIQPIDRTLIRCYHSGQSAPGSDGNKGVLCIPHSSSITGTSPSDGLMLYLGRSLVGSYASAEKQSVYYTAPADWVKMKISSSLLVGTIESYIF